jgi:hypothetical protein
MRTVPVVVFDNNGNILPAHKKITIFHGGKFNQSANMGAKIIITRGRLHDCVVFDLMNDCFRLRNSNGSTETVAE